MSLSDDELVDQVIEKYFGPPEDLDPELAECLMETEHFIFIKHPLVNGIYHPVENALFNKQLARKREALAEARETQDWDSFIWIHERPWRLEALQEIAPDLSNQKFWNLVARVWIDSENIRENYRAWDRLLRIDRLGRQFMMDDVEQEALAQLPDVITVYQGRTGSRDDGWSWTTQRKTAEWFARRFALLEQDEAWVATGTVDKANVLAYLLGRSEAEILVAPESVIITREKRLDPRD